MVTNLSSSVLGMDSAKTQMLRVSGRISGMGSENTKGNESVSLEKEIVTLMEAENSFKANAVAFKASDEMLGTLLDILA